ncbi:MAG: hypothetical protein GY750_06020 [Lentisphaerae bacterium]|nr:hypothetical protein [Lentisphaerota bacterium]
MKMTVHVNGLIFETPTTEEATVEEAKAAIYENIERLNKIEFETVDGSFVVMGEKSLQSAVLVFSEA